MALHNHLLRAMAICKLVLGECITRYCLAHSQRVAMCHLIKELRALEVMLGDEDVIKEFQGDI